MIWTTFRRKLHVQKPPASHVTNPKVPKMAENRIILPDVSFFLPCMSMLVWTTARGTLHARKTPVSTILAQKYPKLVFHVFQKNSPWTFSPSAPWMKDGMVLNVFWNLNIYWKSGSWFMAQKDFKGQQSQVFRVRFLQFRKFKKSWCSFFSFLLFQVPKALKLSRSVRTLQVTSWKSTEWRPLR